MLFEPSSRLGTSTLANMRTNIRITRMVLGPGARRAFSTTSRRLDNYAFIGLGQMVRRRQPLGATVSLALIAN